MPIYSRGLYYGAFCLNVFVFEINKIKSPSSRSLRGRNTGETRRRRIYPTEQTTKK